MNYSREKVIDVMKSWIGKKESNNSHKEIIDIYNSITPLPAGYKVKYTDSWCAATVSAAFHKIGYDEIFPFECSCPRMISKAQVMRIWVENDNYKPNPGDVIMYDWQDNGIGDNTGTADHVGVIEKVNGDTLTVIEGNYSDSVKRREIKVDGKFIRGYITPKFEENQNEVTNVIEKPSNYQNYSVGKVYKTKVNLNVRQTPNGKKLPYINLTPDGKKHGYRDSSGYAILAKGTNVTCKAVKVLDSSTWIKIPSGWICAITSNGTIYIS